MTARVRIGDIVEITTKRGLAYAQYTHRHRRYGALLRVLEGLCEERPGSFRGLAGGKMRFHTFFPLQAAVNRGIVAIVGNESVPDHAKDFPVFRAGVVDPRTGRVGVWWLWDGKNEWRVGELTSEQRKMPIRGVVNDTILIERIESGWTPETDPTT